MGSSIEASGGAIFNGAGRAGIFAETVIVKANKGFGSSYASGQYNLEGIGACVGALS